MAEPGAKAQKAAQGLFTASAAANAIPVFGQFASAGLAIAGLFTKIFGGRKAKKKAAERKAQEKKLEQAKGAVNPQANSSSGPGLAPSEPQAGTAVVNRAETPSFSSWGGGDSPSVQPTQQAINNRLGMG